MMDNEQPQSSESPVAANDRTADKAPWVTPVVSTSPVNELTGGTSSETTHAVDGLNYT